MQSKKMEVLENKLIAKNTYRLIFKGELKAKCGQFVGLEIPGFTLRRPLSLSRIHKDSFEIIYKIKGKGTKELATIKPQEELEILGPLGNGFTLVENKNVLLVGGGIGVPPLLELYHQLKEKNQKVTLLIGLQTPEENAYEEYQPLVCCMETQEGFQGTVVDYLQQKELDFDYVYACGPMGMLHALSKITQEGQISIEERMACGFGVCRGCTCKTNNQEKKRICVDGPVFEIGEVNFDEHHH